MFLLQSGALWHLLVFLFNYDYTLDEGGVEVSSETNQQVLRENKQQQQDSQHVHIWADFSNAVYFRRGLT